MNYSTNELNDSISIFGKQKIKERIEYFKLYLQSFIEQYPTINLSESIDDCALIYALEYFKNSAKYIKSYLENDKLSNRYKIASCSVFTIISLELMTIPTNSSHDINLKFAKYVCYQTLFSFNKNYFKLFDSYLNSNASKISDEFDRIQNHHKSYFDNFSLAEYKYLPIMLYSLFLQSFIQWIEFKDPNAAAGLQL